MLRTTILVLVALAAGATPAWAELVRVDSLEWMAVDADAIAVGEITAIEKLETPGQRRHTWMMTLRVREMLKGKAGRELRFAVVSDYVSQQFDKKKRRPVLVFLVRPARYPKRRPPGDPAWMDRPGYTYDGWPAIALDRPGARAAPSRDFTMKTTGPAILATVRKAVSQAAAKRPGAVFVDVPWDSQVMKAMYGGSAVELRVPLDAATERRAIADLSHRDVSRRAEAAAILGHYRSDGNIARLRKLLSDPGAWTSTMQRPDGTRVRTRVFAVRKRAYEALKKWGVEVARPVLEEKLRP